MFLAGVLGDQTDCESEYVTTETMAMMMANEALLLDDEAETKAPLRVPSIHEVPRLSLDSFQGGQIHESEEDSIGSLLQSSASNIDPHSCPTQAAPAALISARSRASLISSPHTETSINTSVGGGEVEDELEDIAPRTYALITDGSQFRSPFWIKEAAALHKLLQKLKVRHPEFEPKTVPPHEELQMQFVKWLLERPTLPLLVAPASSGFYDEIYGYTPPRLQNSSGFFDEEYVAGRRTGPVHRDSFANTLNPAHRSALTYHEAYTAQLTTAAEIDRHEQRLYQ